MSNKTSKPIYAVLILVIMLAALMSCSSSQREAADNTAEPEVAVTDSAAAVAGDGEPKTIAYYFHGNRRCANCIKIEKYTTEAVEQGFADLIASGRLEFRIINTDEAENRHFNDDYQLFTKSVVLVNEAGGAQVRWKNLSDIWNLLDDQEAFVGYVKQEVTYFIEDV